MEILTTVSAETIAVIIGTVVGGVVAPFAAALGEMIYRNTKK